MRPDAHRAAHSESGTSCPSLGGRGNTEFASDTSRASGESKAQVNRHLARAEALGEDLDEIAGTSRDMPLVGGLPISATKSRRGKCVEKPIDGHKKAPRINTLGLRVGGGGVRRTISPNDCQNTG